MRLVTAASADRTVQPSMMEEAVRLILAMWTDKRVTFRGRISTPRMQSWNRSQYRSHTIMIAGGGAAYAARRRQARRCVQCGWRSRHGEAQVRGAARPLRRRAAQLYRDRTDQHHQLPTGA